MSDLSCPKCGFALEDESIHRFVDGAPTEGSCPSCGVIFSKLVAKATASERPRTPPAPAGVRAHRPARDRALAELRETEAPKPGFSIVNVGLLTIAACTTAYLYWQWARPPETNETAALSRPAATDGSHRDRASAEQGSAAPMDSASPNEGGGLTLVLPGFAAPDPETPPAGGSSAPSIPDLPSLSESTVTDEVLERAKSAARDHPEVKWLEEYALMAHLLLAKRAIGVRDFARALRYLEDSERYGAESGDVASFKALIYKEQQEWELAERWAETALAYGSEANPAEMHHVIGLAHYFREEIDKAIQSFETALSMRDDPEIRVSLERARREARASDGFDQKRLSHFIVSYEGETMEDTGRMVLDQIARSYSSLVSDLGFEPSEPVVVILYSRRSYREMGGPHWSAGFFDGKIRVPVRGLERLDSNLRTTLHHELAHAFIHAKAGDAAPRWLHEGIAQHVEGVRTSQEYGKQFAELLNDGQTFEHCLANASCDVRVFYPAAASLLDFMVQNRGIGGVRDVLSAMEDGLTIDQSLQKVWGRDQRSIIRDWQHFIRRRYS